MALPLGGRPATAVAGAVVLAGGLALAATAVGAVIRHHTTVVPHHAVTNLLTSGPYRLSRNPMYAGPVVAYAGLSLVLGSWWPLVLLPLVVLAMHRLVIRPEERYLGGRFGAAYSAYRTRVRRWL